MIKTLVQGCCHCHNRKQRVIMIFLKKPFLWRAYLPTLAHIFSFTDGGILDLFALLWGNILMIGHLHLFPDATHKLHIIKIGTCFNRGSWVPKKGILFRNMNPRCIFHSTYFCMDVANIWARCHAKLWTTTIYIYCESKHNDFEVFQLISAHKTRLIVREGLNKGQQMRWNKKYSAWVKKKKKHNKLMRLWLQS